METYVGRRGAVELYSGGVPEMSDIVTAKIKQLESLDRDDAFFIVDLNMIHGRLLDWRRLLPRVQPFYAIKCNNDPEVARFLADAGIGFDCASKREIAQVLDLGVEPSRIVFAHPCKQSSHVQFASQNDVDLMTFDDLHELVKIKKYYPRARLLLRIKSSREHKAKHSFNTKFGCEPDAAVQLFKHAQNMGLSVVGISFHVGSLPESVSGFAASIAEASRAFKAGEDMGLSMSVLDIGGGFPGVDSDHMTFEKVACVVNCALDEHFPVSRNVRIIAEPGRYMVTSGFTLTVRVIAKRTVGRRVTDTGTCAIGSPYGVSHVSGHSPKDELTVAEDIESENRSERLMYYINDGIFGSFINVFTDHAVIVPNLVLDPKDHGKTNGGSCHSNRKYQSVIWGPTCDGLDCVMKDCRLPELDVGQWLYFRDMGAYTITLSSDFNGVPRPLRFYVCDVFSWRSVYPKGCDETYMNAPPLLDRGHVWQVDSPLKIVSCLFQDPLLPDEKRQDGVLSSSGYSTVRCYRPEGTRWRTE